MQGAPLSAGDMAATWRVMQALQLSLKKVCCVLG